MKKPQTNTKRTLTHLEVQNANAMLMDLSQSGKMKPWYVISANITELEPHAKKVETFILKVATELKMMNPEGTKIVFDNLTKNKKFDEATKLFYSKTVQVDLTPIPAKELTDVALDPTLMIELMRMKLVV